MTWPDNIDGYAVGGYRKLGMTDDTPDSAIVFLYESKDSEYGPDKYLAAKSFKWQSNSVQLVGINSLALITPEVLFGTFYESGTETYGSGMFMFKLGLTPSGISAPYAWEIYVFEDAVLT